MPSTCKPILHGMATLRLAGTALLGFTRESILYVSKLGCVIAIIYTLLKIIIRLGVG